MIDRLVIEPGMKGKKFVSLTANKEIHIARGRGNNSLVIKGIDLDGGLSTEPRRISLDLARDLAQQMRAAIKA